MAHGEFVWCDLSARRLTEARDFYGRLFGWRYEQAVAPDGAEYITANTTHATAGLYAMPARFIEMGMPCFWMSYIEVTSVKAAITIASDHGAKIELGPVEGPDDTQIALIRDPLGAGFTVVEGAGLSARPCQPLHGDMAWNELYVSNAEAVSPFYQALFGWTISRGDTASHSYDIALDGRVLSAIHQLPDNVRGKEQYWAVSFAVDDLAAARSCVQSHGQLLYEDDGAIVARDGDGAVFFLISASKNDRHLLDLSSWVHWGLGLKVPW